MSSDQENGPDRAEMPLGGVADQVQHLLAIGQRGNPFAPLDAEPAFRRHDAFHSEDLQLIAVIRMR